jgi:hypothetical protein
VRVIEPARDRHRDNDGKRVRFERSEWHSILRQSLKSAGPIPRQAPPGLHCSENKVLSCTAATTGTRKIGMRFVGNSVPRSRNVFPTALLKVLSSNASLLERTCRSQKSFIRVLATLSLTIASNFSAPQWHLDLLELPADGVEVNEVGLHIGSRSLRCRRRQALKCGCVE